MEGSRHSFLPRHGTGPLRVSLSQRRLGWGQLGCWPPLPMCVTQSQPPREAGWSGPDTGGLCANFWQAPSQDPEAPVPGDRLCAAMKGPCGQAVLIGAPALPESRGSRAHSRVSTGGGLRACRGISSVCADWVSTKIKSSKPPRQSGKNWTVYWQVIPGATIPPFPGNIPVGDKSDK